MDGVGLVAGGVVAMDIPTDLDLLSASPGALTSTATTMGTASVAAVIALGVRILVPPHSRTSSGSTTRTEIGRIGDSTVEWLGSEWRSVVGCCLVISRRNLFVDYCCESCRSSILLDSFFRFVVVLDCGMCSFVETARTGKSPRHSLVRTSSLDNVGRGCGLNLVVTRFGSLPSTQSMSVSVFADPTTKVDPNG